MIKIEYKEGTQIKTVTYNKPGDFLGRQYLEVPDFQDNVVIDKVTINDQVIVLDDMTMLGLFNYLNN